MFHLLTREITLLQSWDWRGEKGRREEGREGMKESFYDGDWGGEEGHTQKRVEKKSLRYGSWEEIKANRNMK